VTAASRKPDPMTRVLSAFRDPEKTDFADAWVGMEPTFQTRKCVRRWQKLSAKKGGEDLYFEDDYILRTQERVARGIKKKYEAKCRKGGRPSCIFDRIKLFADQDQWDVRRQNLNFYWPDDHLEPFEVRFTLDPETFEYSIKPVPLAWFYDERFVAFLEGCCDRN